jgi:polar amino acid transport system substrate-binding protein
MRGEAQKMQYLQSEDSHGHPTGIATYAIGLLAAIMLLCTAMPARAATLDRIRQSGKITFGYRPDARPFSYRDEAGKAAGYTVALCEKIAARAKSDLKLPALTVEWVPLTAEDRFQAVQQGRVDLLCGADSEELERRQQVAFSIPVFLSGIGAVLRADSPYQLRDLLSEGAPVGNPVWRASPARTVLEKKTFSVVKGTTAETWLAERLETFELAATVVPVEDYKAGIRRVLDRGADVFFGDRPIIFETAARDPAARDLTVLDRLFTVGPLALSLGRNEDDFRLIVDRALSQLFRSHEFQDVYGKWFGEGDGKAIAFVRMSAPPE